MGATRAQLNRRIRQDQLKDYLSKRGLVDKVLENVDKMDNLVDDVIKGADKDDIASDINKARLKLDSMKASNADRLKLISKYLPDEKYIEVASADETNKQLDKLTDAELKAIIEEG